MDAALAAPAVANGQVVLGVDWARYCDYTAVVAVRGTRERSEVIHTDRWSGLRWAEVISKVKVCAESLNTSRLICDATGVGDPVTDELRDSLPGVPVEGFLCTRKSKVELIERLVWVLERGRLRLPSDVMLLRELEHYEGSADESSGIRYAASAGFHDDLVCALAMACRGLPHGRGVGIISRPRA
ncbi:MAG: hypothetical protein IH851_00845 [Armatimonadetes bacterium]|nr:hypothetical protein [Armatimonadota bacterium]